MKLRNTANDYATEAPSDELIDIQTLAHWLKVPVSGVRALLFQKKIPSVRIGRRVRFEKTVLIEWLKSQRHM